MNVGTFQFQSGAVKRDNMPDTEGGNSKFQFQSGAVKSLIYYAICNNIICFNSKVVRLKDLHLSDALFLSVSFNSKVVRLKEEIDNLFVN